MYNEHGAVSDNSFEIIANVDAVMRSHLQGAYPYFVVGGIATAALTRPDTVIDTLTQRIIPPEDVYLPTIRPNGSPRDIDVLVGCAAPAPVMSHIKADLTKRAIRGALEVSVFGFDPLEDHLAEKGGWVSRRLQDKRGTGSFYQLGAVIQKVQPESYEPWKLQLPRKLGEVSVLHPVGQMMAYGMRSISGVRAKDTGKHIKMKANILQHPEMRQALNEGPFREWKQFADALVAIRDGKDVRAEMLQPGTTRRDIALMRWRGRLLKMVERHATVVDVAQKPAMQKVLNAFVRAAE